jgi:hypothetical protein
VLHVIDVDRSGDRVQGDMSPRRRTEWFFGTERSGGRPIRWLQKRLEFPAELAREIDDLRLERNRLAHGYLTRIAFTEPDSGEVVADRWENELPASVRRDEEG